MDSKETPHMAQHMCGVFHKKVFLSMVILLKITRNQVFFSWVWQEDFFIIKESRIGNYLLLLDLRK